MIMKPVTSSNIAALGHDPESNTLHVHFRNGAHYAYPGVSSQEHHELVNATSIGSHLHQHIKSKYRGVRQP